MAGGQRIDDHSFWAGGHSKASVFPEGAKSKHYSSDGHAGHESDYEDTSEKIKAQQQMAERKAEKHAQKPLHRN